MGRSMTTGRLGQIASSLRGGPFVIKGLQLIEGLKSYSLCASIVLLRRLRSVAISIIVSIATEDVLSAEVPGQLALAPPASNLTANFAAPAENRIVEVPELEDNTITKPWRIASRTGKPGWQGGLFAVISTDDIARMRFTPTVSTTGIGLILGVSFESQPTLPFRMRGLGLKSIEPPLKSESFFPEIWCPRVISLSAMLFCMLLSMLNIMAGAACPPETPRLKNLSLVILIGQNMFLAVTSAASLLIAPLMHALNLFSCMLTVALDLALLGLSAMGLACPLSLYVMYISIQVVAPC